MPALDKSALTGFTTAHAAAVIVGSALLLLILIRRGFRGVSFKGVGSVNVS